MSATLTRAVLGRLGSYGATTIANVRSAFNAADWTAQGDTPAVFVSSGSLVVGVTNTAGGKAWAGNVTIGPVADAYVQARWASRLRNGCVAGLISRYQGNALDYLNFGAAFSNQNEVREVVAGATVQSELRQPLSIAAVRFQSRVTGTDFEGTPFGVGSNMTLSGVGLATAGTVGISYFNNNGISVNGQAVFDEFYATRNHLIKVTSGLTAGWYFNVLNAAGQIVGTSDNASGGTATINAYNRMLVLPLVASIEVREAASGNLLVSATPVETVWPGDEWTFTPAGGYNPPSGVSRLIRGTLGRLAAFSSSDTARLDVTTRFIATQWTGYANTGSVTPSVSTTGQPPGSLSLLTGSGTSPRGAMYNALQLPVDHFILARRFNGPGAGFMGVVARGNIVSPTANLLYCNMPVGQTAAYSIVERIASVNTATSGTTANRSESFPTVHGLWARGTLADSRQTSSTGTGSGDEAIDVALNVATIGQYGGVVNNSNFPSSTFWSSWAAMRSAILRITGPNLGTWQVRLRNAAGTLLYTSPSHTGGVVEINTLDEMTVLYSGSVPLMAQIEIYEPATLTVERGPEVPNETLWGGDQWSWDVYVPPTPSYPPGRLAHRKAGAQRLLLKR
jgi:hypothetical protein